MSWKTDLKQFEANNYSGSAELLDQYMDILLYWLDREEMNSPKERSALTDHIRKLMEIHNTLFVLVHKQTKGFFFPVETFIDYASILRSHLFAPIYPLNI